MEYLIYPEFELILWINQTFYSLVLDSCLPEFISSTRHASVLFLPSANNT